MQKWSAGGQGDADWAARGQTFTRQPIPSPGRSQGEEWRSEPNQQCRTAHRAVKSFETFPSAPLPCADSLPTHGSSPEKVLCTIQLGTTKAFGEESSLSRHPIRTNNCLLSAHGAAAQPCLHTGLLELFSGKSSLPPPCLQQSSCPYLRQGSSGSLGGWRGVCDTCR
jgi:hypothetical protein